MKIKALLVLLDIHNDSDSRRLQPLGISYLQSTLIKNGIECDILDCNLIDGFKDNDLLKIISDKNYNFVGFSIFSSSFDRVLALAKKIKKSNNSIFVSAGGVHSTICHEQIIKDYDCFDFAMRGDGETQLLKLMQDLELNNKATIKLDGVSYKNLNGKISITDTIYQENDLDSLPFPTRDNFDKYSTRFDRNSNKNLINVGVSTSRGCPYNCAFCSIPCMSLKWRGRSPENIAQEIYEIYRKNNDIFIVYIDDNFFVDYARAIKIVESVNKKCSKILPFSFATRVNQIISAGQHCVNKLKENGCIAVELGIENGSNAVLNRYQKYTTVEENIKAINMLREANINIGIDFIMFDRYTSINEIKENISFFKENKLWGYYPTLIYKKVIPYPGTKVEKNYGKFKEKNYFVNKDVSFIFKKLNKFFLNFAINIEKLLSINNIDNQLLILLKTMPYNYLDLLVDNIHNKTLLNKKSRKYFADSKKFIREVKRRYVNE